MGTTPQEQTPTSQEEASPTSRGPAYDLGETGRIETSKTSLEVRLVSAERTTAWRFRAEEVPPAEGHEFLEARVDLRNAGKTETERVETGAFGFSLLDGRGLPLPRRGSRGWTSAGTVSPNSEFGPGAKTRTILLYEVEVGETGMTLVADPLPGSGQTVAFRVPGP